MRFEIHYFTLDLCISLSRIYNILYWIFKPLRLKMQIKVRNQESEELINQLIQTCYKQNTQSLKLSDSTII